ncbi:hypothetical protein GQ55_5G474800 [Panicum hallii var. hallii]|uniref:AB hydrolase-1 domain-containing protein n=1 Tax=Panicum hallii var. hallii TaxID=1504633 RepID=A0A2T7DQZ3_9POAL|nr:hypothetical protein GQ55_5G474800 [Panicum hallii var. hallii]
MGILRLLPLALLLLLPAGIREYLSPAIDRAPGEDGGGGGAAPGGVVLHPIVLVPGVSCSELEVRLTDAYRPSLPRCGAMKGKGWFGLWANCSDLPAHHYIPCFMEQMSLVYDSAAGDYRNLPGVETRVRNFGSSRGFQRNPKHTDWCLEIIRQELERVGYRDGDTLFGAPYDLRHAPPVPGYSSAVFSRYFRQLTRLIEDASRRNQGRKAILFGHSFGGMVALDFVRSTPMAWRERHIKHLVLAAPLTAGGFVQPVQLFASGSDLLFVPGAEPLALTLRPMWRTFESAIVNFPSPAVFGRRPLVITRERNYSADDMADFLAAAGYGAAAEPFRRRAVPRMGYFQAPMVPTTVLNGVGIETPEQLVYWDGDFDAEPGLVNGDGDEDINLASMLAFDEQMRRQPEQNKLFKTIKLRGARHGTIVTEDWSLKRVMQEILEANRID